MDLLCSNEFVELARDPERSILRYVRTAVPFASIDQIQPAHRDVIRAFDRFGRSTHGLLVDLRLVRANDDPGFEQAMQRVRTELLRGFARVAIVVRSAAGALQLNRHAREDGHLLRVFHGDVDAALAHLESARTGGPDPRRRA